MGWPHVFRIWTPEWLRDSESVISRIVELSDQLAAGKTIIDVNETADSEVVDDLNVIPDLKIKNSSGLRTPAAFADELTENNWRPFIPSVVGVRDYLDYLPRSREAVNGVRTIMQAIVEQEGPVAFTRLCQLTAASFGLTKVNANREATITSVIPQELQKTKDERFAWPAEIDPDSWTDFRPSDDYKIRTLDIISLREIANAMSYHSRMALGMEKEDLFKETLATFGAKRLTPAIEERLESALQHGLNSGKLAVDAGGVYKGVTKS
jgi:hypothetical protein